MKNVIILLAIVLVGAGVTAGALTSTSFGWTPKPLDDKKQSGNITLELPDEPLIWADLDVIDFVNVSLELPKPVVGDICVSVDAGLYPVGVNVVITLENTGCKTAYFYGPSYHWTIDKYTDGTWKRAHPNGIEIQCFLVTKIGPGGAEVDTWDQKIFDDTMTEKVQVDPGDYRVVVDYSMGEEKYHFTDYVYFSISNYAIDVKPSNNIKLELPEYPAVWDNRESMLVPLPSMQTTPPGGVFPEMPTAEVPLGKYWIQK